MLIFLNEFQDGGRRFKYTGLKRCPFINVFKMLLHLLLLSYKWVTTYNLFKSQNALFNLRSTIVSFKWLNELTNLKSDKIVIVRNNKASTNMRFSSFPSPFSWETDVNLKSLLIGSDVLNGLLLKYWNMYSHNLIRGRRPKSKTEKREDGT